RWAASPCSPTPTTPSRRPAATTRISARARAEGLIPRCSLRSWAAEAGAGILVVHPWREPHEVERQRAVEQRRVVRGLRQPLAALQRRYHHERRVRRPGGEVERDAVVGAHVADAGDEGATVGSGAHESVG